MLNKLLLSAMLAVCTATAQADAVYTVPNDHGIGSIGPGATTTYGEVFTVANDGNTRLDSFSFFLTGNVASMYGGVASWTGTGAGAALFTSGQLATAFGTPTEVTFETGGLNLVSGQQYVYYVSAAGAPSGLTTDQSSYSQAGVASIFDGMAWDNASGGSPNHEGWDGCRANCGFGNFAGTLAFSAPSSNVPEPASVALLGLGAVGLVRARRRRAR